MKTKLTLLILAFFLISQQLVAKKPEKINKYRRSSLAMILIESKSFPDKDIVMQAWNNYPFPDKYNDHNVDVSSMDPDNYVVTREDLKDAGMRTSFFNTSSDAQNSLKEMPIKIEKFIKSQNIAKKMVSKWFDRSPDGTFDTKLIEERGFYNATAMDAAIAKHQIRGLALLGDAGEQLINNTFVTFSKVTFVQNEPVARKIRDIAILTIQQKVKNPIAQSLAIAAARLAYEKAKEGYSVWTHTWLYKLDWNDSISNFFYTNLWDNKEAYDSSHIFRFKYVGMASSKSLVTFSLKKGQGHRTNEQIINLATGRNIDKVFAKLQKDFDVFKPKIPVLSTDPITARIGLKEGVKPGDKFEVLEMEMDTTTGKTTYVKVGKVKVSKKFPIWDNRYNMGIPDSVTSDVSSKVTATTFKGSSNIQPGMLLVQIK